MTPNDFLKIILNANNKLTDPPKGWYSRRDLSELWNIKKTSCRDRIIAGIKAGLIEEKDYYIPNVNGTLICVPHYFFVDKKTNKKTCIK